MKTIARGNRQTGGRGAGFRACRAESRLGFSSLPTGAVFNPAVGTVANDKNGKSQRHHGERGFALLLVFLMAAVIGIALFAELPRVAIQAQRAKEQLLVERGEQFKRAIQLFLRANKGTRYPVDMDDLDRGYNNMRFLRHRYKDPMTGKDEWRIIHMQGGVLIDSLLNKPKDSDKPEASTLGQNISAQAGLGQVADAGTAQPNAMNRRRPSEGGTGGGMAPDGQPGDQGGATLLGDTAGGAPPGSSGTSGGPASPFGTATGTPSVPGQPAPSSAAIAGGATGGSSSDSGSSVGGYGSAFGSGTAGNQQNAPGLAGSLNPANAANGANGPVPGASPGQNTAAAGLINQMLMGPRPGGLAGLGPAQGGVAMAGGMAGVASKMDSDSLMVYNDQTNYKQWEFVYDPTKDRPRQDPRTMLVGNQMGTPSNSAPGSTTPSAQQPGAFNQSGQSGATGQATSNNQTGTNGQTGTSTNTGGATQGGAVDLRPGKK
jgi:hypothetical protein